MSDQLGLLLSNRLLASSNEFFIVSAQPDDDSGKSEP